MKENRNDKENNGRKKGLGPNKTGVRGLGVTFPQQREFAGHRFVHLAGGLYKAEEEFKITNEEARRLLREYWGVRLYVRSRKGQNGRYSDYYSNYSLAVGKYPVYQVLYAYEAEYVQPSLEVYLEDDMSFHYDKKWFLGKECMKLEEWRRKSFRKSFEMDLLCNEVFQRIDAMKNLPDADEQEMLANRRNAFEWSWPEGGVDGYVRFGNVVCEVIEEGIYKAVRYFSLGDYWDYDSAYIWDFSFPEGVTPDDIAYECSIDMCGGWGIPMENEVEMIAVGSEHFARLRELVGKIYYHPESKRNHEKS